MKSIKSADHSQNVQRKYSDLDRRYGKIGISAVAAALAATLRYRDEAPIPVYARSILNDRD